MFEKRAKASRAGEAGYTMVELLVAMFIGAIVAASLFGLYNMFFAKSRTQDLMLESQQNARAAIDLMERELINAGLNPGDADVITIADANAIEFVYTDPETDEDLSDTAGQRLKVKYALVTSGGITYLVRNMGICGNSECTAYSNTRNNEPIIPNVQSFQVQYHNVDGATFTPATQADRDTIRFATLTLTTQTSEAIAGTGQRKTFTVKTHLRLRNMGIGKTAEDTSPPTTPTGLKVRDPGTCGVLKVKFNENTEGDIAGYKIYYGTTAGSYPGVIDVRSAAMSGSGYNCVKASGTIECTLTPTSVPLSYSPSDDSGDVTYYFAVKSYDSSFNHSAYSATASGNPTPSNSDFASGTDDSTIDVGKPVAVTGLTGANGPADGQISLSWSAYDTAAYTDVEGFRVYRSTAPFAAYPIDPAAAGIEWIAGEPGSGRAKTLSATDTSLLDDTSTLTGCSMYYYAIAPVKCDATLVTDEGSDPNEKKYISTDYNVTYGDGSSGAAADSPTGSDTAPPDTTAPSAPGIGVNAGWRRVAVSLTQPSNNDLSRTCIYVNEGADYPAVRTDTATYPLEATCYQVAPDGKLVPDSGGSFTTAEVARSQSSSFWHDSMTLENPGAPSLSDLGTYSYRAVAFDLCDNGSSATGAQATTTLCGEDPATGEKPPAVTNGSASCCDTPVTLTWTEVSSTTSLPSSPTNPYDLAGYRVFRSTQADKSDATLISGDAPYWGSSFQDAGVSDGGPYYYTIVSTDCPYERENPSAATIKANMLSGYLNSLTIGPVYPGQILRDEKCSPTSTGYPSCTKDDHREVLTGVDINNDAGNGNNAPTPQSSYWHNTVTMFVNNTSNSTMTIESISVGWVNVDAHLTGVTIGGGRSGMGEISTTIPTGNTTTVSGFDPYTRAVMNQDLTDAQIPAAARYVPITFTFTDSDGDPVGMRLDQIIIELGIKNDSTTTTGCLSYMTVSGADEGTVVPLGPTVTSTTQDLPLAPTFAYSVPGPLGLNTVPSGSDADLTVNGGSAVTISATITPQTTHAVTGTKVPVSSATLYYKATANTVTTAPASGYTAVSMSDQGGNVWSADIPDQEGFRVWYYIVAYDEDGNYDRDPEIAEGAYTYDQIEYVFNACDYTPNEPTNLTAVAGGSGPSSYTVTLNWTAPATYTTGAAIDATDTIQYRVYDKNGTLLSTQAGLSYVHSGLSTGIQRYTVKAINSCSPTPNASAASTEAAACTGSSGYASIAVDTTSIVRGDSYTVTIVDCLAIAAPYNTTIETVNSTGGFTGHYSRSTWPETYAPTIAESAVDSGTFTKTIETTGDVAESGKLHVLAVDTISVYYPYASPTTVTIEVREPSCTDIPNAPGGFTGSVTGQNIALSWSAVTHNTNGTTINDLGGYYIYEKVCAKDKPNCTGTDIVADWFLRTSVSSATTSVTLSADQGNVSQRMYYFQVKAFDTCSPANASSAASWNEP
jgi:type IV pilus assembly protein PilW